MSSAPAQPPDQVALLRQQVILAQVRIMELEDAHLELAARRDQLDHLLREAQMHADEQAEACAHLEGVQGELQQQLTHLRHVQHVTQAALEATRVQLAAAEQAKRAGDETSARLQAEIAERNVEARDLARSREAARADAERHARRIAELDAERQAMQASRSWRWTAWIRAMERRFRRRTP